MKDYKPKPNSETNPKPNPEIICYLNPEDLGPTPREKQLLQDLFDWQESSKKSLEIKNFFLKAEGLPRSRFHDDYVD